MSTAIIVRANFENTGHLLPLLLDLAALQKALPRWLISPLTLSAEPINFSTDDQARL
jgi:hypothetical protein